MSETILQSIAAISEQLSNRGYDNGVLTGDLKLDQFAIDRLVALNKDGVVEDTFTVAGQTQTISQLKMGDYLQITLYTKRLKSDLFYDTVDEFVRANLGKLPAKSFYIAENAYASDSGSTVPAMIQFKDVARFIAILTKLADFVQSGTGKNTVLIFFQKKKLNIPLIMGGEQLRSLSFLDDLETQFEKAHDNTERKTIFKTELVASLSEIPENEVFAKLLADADEIYQRYLQSHLLYLEKFSYQDLKAEIDKDQLDYTKKIYGTVNDIQAKLIAVPAAFLLIFAQFDFTGVQFFKNILILVGAVLFSILIDLLLRNQFGVLKYVRTEIEHLKTTLKNKDTQVDLSEFITSFANLEPVMNQQRSYLWFFRIVTWLVPVATVIMLLVFSRPNLPVK